MKLFMVAVAATAAVLFIPVSASAWTPDECAAWYLEHGSNHPDCQSYVPPVVTPPPAPEQPAPPVETPPVTVPETPPVVEDVPPVDTPNLVPPEATPKPQPAPILVKGKEQTTPTKARPEQVAAVETGTTLPYTGLPLLPVLVAGLALGLTGFAARKALRS